MINPNHFYYGNNWEITTFLPLFNFTLAHEVKCGDCPLAAYGHPLVQTEYNDHEYNKLCTLQVIKAGLLTIDKVFTYEGGCCKEDDDYKRAKQMFSSKSQKLRLF